MNEKASVAPAVKTETSNFSETCMQEVKEEKIEKMTIEVQVKENKARPVSNKM